MQNSLQASSCIRMQHIQLLPFAYETSVRPVPQGQLRGIWLLHRTHFRILLAGVCIFVINMCSRHSGVVILQLDFVPELRLLLSKLVWKWLALCTSPDDQSTAAKH